MNIDDWGRPKVLVAHTAMAPKLVPYLDAEASVVCTESIADASEDVREAADAVVGHQFPTGSLAGLPNLRWLHLTGTGTDHLVAAGLAPGVLVTNSARVPAESVAEYAVSALLMLLKDFPALSARPQNLPWFMAPASMLRGSTVLVVGAGRIGQGVVRRLAALGAQCVAVTRTGAMAVPYAARTVSVSSLLEAAASADHVVCCLPDTAETADLVDERVLTTLPPHAVLVNVGRASTVDEAALHAALRSGTLRGAFLDVHRTEPLPPDDPSWTVPHLVVSPHRAFAFPEEPAEVARTFLENLADLRARRSPRDLVPVESSPPARATGAQADTGNEKVS